MAKIDISQLREYEKNGLLRIQKHPEAELYIANYTEKVQYDRLWDDLTMMCRGLIFDGDGTIVARPFKKFFNLGEMDSKLIDEPFEVTEKMDGSLGIFYMLNNLPHIATRGSFTSEQAIWATKLIQEAWHTSFLGLDGLLTYLFEIIYPENRIVVDYKGVKNLYLLAIIDTDSGEEIRPEHTAFSYFPIVRRFEGITGIEQLMAEYEGHDNFEGFVIHHTGYSNLRIKVKLPEYVRLHKLLTGINDRRIWEILAAGQSLDPILERVPDEFYQYVKETEVKLLAQHQAIKMMAETEFKLLMDDAYSNDPKEARKQFAGGAMGMKEISSYLFALYDGKEIDDMIWKQIKPEAMTPWKVEV